MTINIHSRRFPVVGITTNRVPDSNRILKALSDRNVKVTINESLRENETCTLRDQSRRTRKSIRHRGLSSGLIRRIPRPDLAKSTLPVGNILILIPGVLPLGLFMNVHY